MKASISLVFMLLAGVVMATEPAKALHYRHEKLVRGTPEEFLAAAVAATGGIRTALEKAAADIEAALTGNTDLLPVVHLILDDAYARAADVLGPALDDLAAATSDEEAEVIVIKTMEVLMMIGLDTEFRIDDAILNADQVTQDQVLSIIASLVGDIKVQIKPLWDLTQDGKKNGFQ